MTDVFDPPMLRFLYVPWNKAAWRISLVLTANKSIRAPSEGVVMELTERRLRLFFRPSGQYCNVILQSGTDLVRSVFGLTDISTHSLVNPEDLRAFRVPWLDAALLSIYI